MKTKVEHKNSELVSIKELGWHQIFMNSFEVNPFEVITTNKDEVYHQIDN